ncbi:hypothetical protein [Stappia sp. ES.058]|uniref:hypothetical protein n=1 Tax=Stappia sp. ES.058 TaxID=1881061 RepID=UPI00087D4455|nr:hypothetical protein [Stappia sp. ES.058]SDT91446.1 hypothetical protein SAMN05428979_0352 [Stappia sp. ES.058]
MSRRQKVSVSAPKRLRSRASVLAVCASALLLAACQTGSDGFNDGTEADEAPDTAMIRGLMEGLGAVDAKSEAKIEYTPRAPLAMPGKLDALPPPEESQQVANWPTQNDQGLKRIQEVYRNDGRGSSDLDGDGRSNARQSRGIQQLVSGGDGRDYAAERQNEDRLESGKMKPNELNQRVGVAETSAIPVDDNGVPIRRYLIEPPTAYSTPSADAPMAAPKTVDRAPEISTTEQIMNGRSARTIE